jgi:hypothetical protein
LVRTWFDAAPERDGTLKIPRTGPSAYEAGCTLSRGTSTLGVLKDGVAA